MGKIKLTKGELKRQNDSLRQYQRYLPTLQLKKQQLQLEIAQQMAALQKESQEGLSRQQAIQAWIGLLSADPQIDIRPWLKPKGLILDKKNVAGVDLDILVRLEFADPEYDLFIAPLWVDAAIERLRGLVEAREKVRVLREGISVLRAELRVTTQRVNLFEKVKIPQAEEAIRLIKIYIGDQMVNAVARSKIAKRKIESEELVLAAA